MLIRAAVVALLAVGVGGCGSDDSRGEADGAPGPRKFPIALKVESGLDLNLTAPSSVPAGLYEISYRTSSPIHDAYIVKVDGDRSARDIVGHTLEPGDRTPTPRWAHASGGVGLSAANETRRVLQVLQPGRYFVLDTNIGENVEGTVPFRVRGPASDAKLPRTAAHITASDYRFEARGLRPGRNRITFSNRGTEPHQLYMYEFEPGVTLRQARRAMARHPLRFEPFTTGHKAYQGAPIGPGGEQVLDVRLRSGRYGMICLMADGAGGPIHAMRGMVSEAVVR